MDIQAAQIEPFFVYLMKKLFSEAIDNYYPICYNYTYQEEEQVERLKASIKFKR